MNQPHYLDTTGICLINGNRAENRFAQIAIGYKLKVKQANFDEDTKKHFDLVIENSKGMKRRVDVKSMKTISRETNVLQDDYIWLELHGVNHGNNGWIFGGKANYIAFETKNEFLLVPRFKLAEFAKKIIESKPNHTQRNDGKNVLPKDGKYTIYTRKDRLDQLVLVERKEIEALTTRRLYESIQQTYIS